MQTHRKVLDRESHPAPSCYEATVLTAKPHISGSSLLYLAEPHTKQCEFTDANKCITTLNPYESPQKRSNQALKSSDRESCDEHRGSSHSGQSGVITHHQAHG